VSADLNGGTAAVTIAFNPASPPLVAADGSAASVPLTIAAQSAGTLTIRGATVFYQENSGTA